MRKYIFILSLLTGFMLNLQAQTESDRVGEVITELFDGMRAGDSARVHAVFADDVRMESFVSKDGKNILHGGSLMRFLTSIGTPHDKIYDERIENLDIKIDGPMAIAWMDYAFYLGEEYSHCGVNVMTLFNEGEAWKIVAISDTRRKACE